ncbi:hypothetical protein ACP8HZ_11030 [Francisella noatunensis]
MDYIQEFRPPKVPKSLLQQIAKEVEPNRQYNLMEFCGGHTHALHIIKGFLVFCLTMSK